jgi:predicted RND superfamily exporter protein
MIEKVSVIMTVKSDTKKKANVKKTTTKKTTSSKKPATKKTTTKKVSDVSKKVEISKVEKRSTKDILSKHPVLCGLIVIVLCYFIGYAFGAIIRLIVG